MTLTVFERTIGLLSSDCWLLFFLHCDSWTFFAPSSRLVPATGCFRYVTYGIFAHWFSLSKMLSLHFRFHLILRRDQTTACFMVFPRQKTWREPPYNPSPLIENMRGLKFFVAREKLYRRSFKCLARSRQHSCLFVCFFLQCYGLFKAACLVSMAHFPWFCWQYFSLITTFLIHSTRTRTFYCVRDSGIFFTCPIVVSPAKPNRCLLKTTDIFSASYALLWLALYGFFCFFFTQSGTNLYSCYKFAVVLKENCTPSSANQNWVIVCVHY